MPYRFLAHMLAETAPAEGGVIRFTVAPTGNRVLTLRDFTLPIDCVVDWGDGTKDAVTSNTAVSHTYADTTPRTVEISGALGGFWNAAARAAGTTFVTSVDKIASPSLVTLAETFRECASLASIPTTLDAPNLTACDRCFYNVRRIESDLPALWLTHTQASHANAFTNCFLSRWGKLGSGCNYRQYVSAVAGQTYYQKYGTGCPSNSYVSGTASRTYYQAYSNGANCPSAMKVSAVAAKTYYQQYGANCTSGTKVAAVAAKTYYQQYGTGCSSRVVTARTACNIYYTCKTNKCGSYRTNYSVANGTQITTYPTYCLRSNSQPMWSGKPPFYIETVVCNASSASGVTTCGSGCKRQYQSGRAAYTKCNVSSTSGVTICGSGCKRQYQAAQAAYTKCAQSSASGVTTCGSGCKRVYSAGTSGYYRCSASSTSGVSSCGSGCKRTYSSGQSAYYKCTKGGTCATTGCPWPYANETAYANAKSAGWA